MMVVVIIALLGGSDEIPMNFKFLGIQVSLFFHFEVPLAHCPGLEILVPSILQKTSERTHHCI